MASDELIFTNGRATPANIEDEARDVVGFTSPNLHRRVDPHEPLEDSVETAPRRYYLGVYSNDSYRTTVISTHSEDSETCEIP